MTFKDRSVSTVVTFDSHPLALLPSRSYRTLVQYEVRPPPAHRLGAIHSIPPIPQVHTSTPGPVPSSTDAVPVETVVDRPCRRRGVLAGVYTCLRRTAGERRPVNVWTFVVRCMRSQSPVPASTVGWFMLAAGARGADSCPRPRTYSTLCPVDFRLGRARRNRCNGFLRRWQRALILWHAQGRQQWEPLP